MQATYEQIKAKVLPQMETYLDDLVKHDAEILADYHGPFLYGYRPSGTDLLKLQRWEDYKFGETWTPEQQESCVSGAITYVIYKGKGNKIAYYDGQQLHWNITTEKAEEIYSAHCLKVFAQRDRQLEPA